MPSEISRESAKPKRNQTMDEDLLSDMKEIDGLTMADLFGPKNHSSKKGNLGKGQSRSNFSIAVPNRSVDDFDFDEETFLAALDKNEPVGSNKKATNKTVNGIIVSIESDGIYVDIGDKAPGFMPKKECSIGAITNLKEFFLKGNTIEALVIREQNADGIITISARALALHQSWEKLIQLEKDGDSVQVKVNGFNRGGLTCELEGLRGFIPCSQLQDGENYEKMVGKTIRAALIEVNSSSQKLILSEKRATTATRFAQLQIGQLIEGQVTVVKPYGFFVDIGSINGLLHYSCITNGNLREPNKIFKQGERIKALITDLDPTRGRIGLNTALLEGKPGELLIQKEKVMNEATDRTIMARNLIRQKEQSTK
uniref:30S ribosomal protein S1-like B, putative n=1 Tax=Paulinella chromatophora TaxID=39717 RepID=B1X5T4_PAUCH|nr:30S ribosomal protein S1-like B, putative [Paulinella chromatophora]ACB43303.1 30S ribosomal protein S1-like B, putative [Paulinella chromatophora]